MFFYCVSPALRNPLQFPELAQWIESHFSLVGSHPCLASQRELADSALLVFHQNFAEGSQLQSETVHVDVRIQRGNNAVQHHVDNGIRFLIRVEFQRRADLLCDDITFYCWPLAMRFLHS